MSRKKQKPYNHVEDYGLDYSFGAVNNSKLTDDQLFHSILRKYLPHIQTTTQEVVSTEGSSSESSDSDDDFPEPHHCRIYSCKDPECYSCELANECQNCSHCGINKTLLLPCLECNTPEIHSVANHREIRCAYHTEFPAPPVTQFSISHNPSKVCRSKFTPIQPIIENKPDQLITDRHKLSQYIADKEIRNDPNENQRTLLKDVLDNTFSQCQITSQCQPGIDLNVDTSRFHEKPFIIPKSVAMPPIIKRPEKVVIPIVSKETPPVVEDRKPDPPLPNPVTDPYEGIGDTSCYCYKLDTNMCSYPEKHLITKEPECVLCSKTHENPCKCYKHRALLEEHKMNVNETINVLIANHTRACYDLNCPLRSKDIQADSIAKWFDTLVKLERLTFQCPLNVVDFGLEDIEFREDDLKKSLKVTASDDTMLPCYITNFLPRPLVKGQKRDNGVSRMKFWDRLNSFQEQFTDHMQSSHIPLIKDISKPIFKEDDSEVTGRYDDIYSFWDRNKQFTTKKILVKTPETLVKLIEVEDLPLKFEALHALNKAARTSKSLQESLGQTKVIVPLLNVLDNCNHDGARRLAIYLISMALRFPSGRCVFFELGPEVIKNLYKHYLTDQRYAMRRAYMLLMSNLLEDTGACSVLCNAVSFENTFANMCEKDPDLQLYLMKMMYYAMHDIEGREKIMALPEFRLTPVLSGCLSKRSRIRETALNLLDAIVSFCKQDVVIKTFKDMRGIKVLGKILRKAYMAYAHPVVLKIYEHLAENPDAGPAIKEGSLANLVEFVETVDDPKLIAHTLRVLVKMARDPLTKEVLALTNVITKIAPLLLHTNEELAQPVLMILELMAAKGSKNLITQQLVKADPMVDLLWVVGSENRGWDTRVIALRCIIALLNLSPYFGECFIKCKNAINVVNLLCHQAKFLTTYSKTLLVQVLSALSKSKRNYEWLIRNKAIKALLYSFKCFDSFESQLYAHSVGLLAFMMKDRRAVIQFSNVKSSWNLLAKKFMEKKFISADILMNLMFLVIDLTDNFELGAKSFMNNGFLRWMIDLEEIYPEMSGSIRNAIDSIIRNYLPLKFAHHGSLGYQDYTNKSLFFVTKKMYNVYTDKEPFPMFDKGISNRLKPEKPIYYFNLPLSMRGASSEDLDKQLKIETSDNFDLYSNVSRSGDSVHQIPEGEEEKFIDMEQDIRLNEMFEEVKAMIAKNHETSPPKNQRDKRINEVIGIAKVVEKSMMGYDPLVSVTRLIQDIYLESMKKHLGTNIFPIGRLVMGYKFERAVLFKLFADVLDIPCWLHRNGDKIAWNEVYVPPQEGYQGGELIPTFLVDLMAPKLLVAKSLEAKAYLKNMDD